MLEVQIVSLLQQKMVESKSLRMIMAAEKHRKIFLCNIASVYWKYLFFSRSYVGLCDNVRIFGEAARDQQESNMKNTFYDFKQLLGRKFDDPEVHNELGMIPYDVEKMLPNETISIRVNFMDKDMVLSPEQILAMLLTKLKTFAEVDLNMKVCDCILTVPSNFTSSERQSLLNAAVIDDLNCWMKLLPLQLATDITDRTHSHPQMQSPSMWSSSISVIVQFKFPS